MHIQSLFILERLYILYIYTTNNIILGLAWIFPWWKKKQRNLNFKERMGLYIYIYIMTSYKPVCCNKADKIIQHNSYILVGCNMSCKFYIIVVYNTITEAATTIFHNSNPFLRYSEVESHESHNKGEVKSHKAHKNNSLVVGNRNITFGISWARTLAKKKVRLPQ
jgi:hypothetical protein